VIIVGFVWEGQEALVGAIDGFAEEFEPPVREIAVLVVLKRVFDDDAPISNAIFAPVCDRHKGPVIVAFWRFVVRPSGGDVAGDSTG
jgi:hypothetical protein